MIRENKKIIFLTQTPQQGASARYRVYQYLSYLKNDGFECTVSPSVNNETLLKYYRNPGILTKFLYYSSAISKRLGELGDLKGYDCVFLQRDIIVHAFPFIEKMIAGRQNKIIFDFDDPIFLYPPIKKPTALSYLFFDKKKIERIIRLSKHVIVANNFLMAYVEKFTEKATLIPTSLDLSLYEAGGLKRCFNGKTTIGWIGSQGTFNYLLQVFPVFIELAKKHDIELKVVGANGKKISGLKVIYKEWNIETEIEDINSFDIGVMPLSDDPWSQGKSGTKLLQYMAAGVPAVASPVGINSEIITEGVNGFLAGNHEEWLKKLSYLIENRELLKTICERARKTVIESYSVEVNAPKLIKVIRDVLK